MSSLRMILLGRCATISDCAVELRAFDFQAHLKKLGLKFGNQELPFADPAIEIWQYVEGMKG